MNFSDLLDATHLMQEVVTILSEDDPTYKDFKFFSAINYTLQSEYRQELKTFLKQLLDGKAMPKILFQTENLAQDIKDLYHWL